MRYFITTHGCHRKNETIDLKSAKLLVHAYENECIRYGEPYLRSFCSKSIHKHKGIHKPKFTVTRTYYEMEFGRQDAEEFDSYIKCCTTGEIIYDFINGDMLLSEVIDLITVYNDHFSPTPEPSPIYISVLTCNTECSDYNTNYGEHLTPHRAPARYPASKNNWNRTRSLVAQSRKQNRSRPVSRGTLKHRFKVGDIAVHPTTGVQTIVTKENKKKVKARGSFFVPAVESGNTVLYQNDLWQILFIDGTLYTLYRLRPGEPRQVVVDARETRKLEI
jgi:hypothetical protein